MEDAGSERERAICRLLDGCYEAKNDLSAAQTVAAELSNLAADETRWPCEFLLKLLLKEVLEGRLDPAVLAQVCAAGQRAELEPEDRHCIGLLGLAATLLSQEPDASWLEVLQKSADESWQAEAEKPYPFFGQPLTFILSCGKLEYALNQPGTSGNAETPKIELSQLDAWTPDSPLKQQALRYAKYLQLRQLDDYETAQIDRHIKELFPAGTAINFGYFINAPRVERFRAIAQNLLDSQIPGDAKFGQLARGGEVDVRTVEIAEQLAEAAGEPMTAKLSAQKVILLSASADSAQGWSDVSRLCAQVLALPDLDSAGYRGEVLIAHAGAMTQDGSGRQEAALAAYFQAYQAILPHAPERGNARQSYERALWQRVIVPALGLAERSAEGAGGSSTLSGQDREAALHSLHKAKGQILLSNDGVRRLLEDPDSEAAAAFAAAARFAPDKVSKVQCQVEQGKILRQLLENMSNEEVTKKRAEAAQLKELAQEIIDGSPAGSADGLHFRGFALATDAELEPNRIQARTMLHEARTAYEAALKLEQRPVFWSDLASVLVSLSYRTPNCRSQLLPAAEQYARKVIDYTGEVHRNTRFQSQISLANAIEDQAYYLGQYWRYPEAVAAFKAADSQLADLDELARYRLLSKTKTGLIRCSLRFLRDREFAEKLCKNKLLAADFQKQLQAGLDSPQVAEPLETLLKRAREITTDPVVALERSFWIAEILSRLDQVEESRSEYENALKLALKIHHSFLHPIRARIIGLEREPRVIKDSLEDSPSTDELEAIVQCLTPDKGELIGELLLEYDTSPRIVACLRFAAARRRYKEIKQQSESQADRADLIKTAKGLIQDAENLDLGFLRMQARQLYCGILFSEMDRDDPVVPIAEAAAEMVAVITELDQQRQLRDSVELRVMLMHLAVRDAATSQPKAVRQRWADIARLLWTDEFRIDADLVRDGLYLCDMLTGKLDMYRNTMVALGEQARARGLEATVADQVWPGPGLFPVDDTQCD